jgi:hypothetical protein
LDHAGRDHAEPRDAGTARRVKDGDDVTVAKGPSQRTKSVRSRREEKISRSLISSDARATGCELMESPIGRAIDHHARRRHHGRRRMLDRGNADINTLLRELQDG